MYETGADGKTRVTGLRIGRQGAEKVIKADAYVAALDVPGAQRLIPSDWRKMKMFDNIYKLVGVPVITVQLR
jgi:zeta-carotene desaturase